LTSNKIKLGIAMMLITSLSAVFLTIPSKVAIAQTSQENQTMQVIPANQTKVTKLMIPFSIAQLRDHIRSNHPLLAAIADRIQTMDIKDTLKYILGVELISDLLKAHARQLIENQTATTPSIFNNP
jgi:hypothetical protein